jgi:hypothetical protein
MKTILIFCTALILNGCTYFDADSLVRKPGPVMSVTNDSENWLFETDYCEYWLFDTKLKRIKNLSCGGSWSPASNPIDYPRGVSPFAFNKIAFSYGSIAQMSYSNNTDNGGCFRLKFMNNVTQPSNIQVGFWDFDNNSFTTYVSEMDTFLDYDTDCCWNNDYSYYFLTQQNQFIDISKFLKFRKIVCFKISY